MVELEGFSGRTETVIAEAKSAGDITRKETIEEFQKFRGKMELWYAGIQAHVEKNAGGTDGKGKGGNEGKGSALRQEGHSGVETPRRP